MIQRSAETGREMLIRGKMEKLCKPKSGNMGRQRSGKNEKVCERKQTGKKLILCDNYKLNLYIAPPL